jgi:regulatory protein YycI of two-component signal transduction system YycFG
MHGKHKEINNTVSSSMNKGSVKYHEGVSNIKTEGLKRAERHPTH